MIFTLLSLLAIFSAEITVVEAKNTFFQKTVNSFRKRLPSGDKDSLTTFSSSEKKPFSFKDIKNDIPFVKETFAKDKSLVTLRHNGNKYIRELKSGEIFAQASAKLHADAFLGKGANGIVKKAFDINDPSKMIAIKKPSKGYLLDMTQEAKNLRHIKGQYKNIDTPVTVKETGKQYLIMKQTKGQNLNNYLSNHKVSPRDTKHAIKNAVKTLDNLHRRGYIHGDPHLKNFKIDKSKVKLVDAGEVAKNGKTFDIKTDKMVFLTHLLNEIRFLQVRNNGLKLVEKSNIQSLKKLDQASASLKGLELRLQKDFNLLAKSRQPSLDPSIEQRYGSDFLQKVQQGALT